MSVPDSNPVSHHDNQLTRWVMLGHRTHQAITLVVAAGLRRGPGAAVAVSAAAREVMAGETGSRTLLRAARTAVTSGAGAYVHRFLPNRDWRLLASEPLLDRSRPDLVWVRDTDGAVLIDEIKTGHALATAAAGSQALRHLAAGQARWGDRLVGVRLLWLTAPNLSQFYTPGRAVPVLLETTPYGKEIACPRT